MNKLIFNEGGQPVCLDDLKMLQENSLNGIATLMRVIGNGINAFLLEEINLQKHDDIISPNHRMPVTLKAGTLVLDGEFLQWKDTDFTISDDDPIYLCVRDKETDTRVFEDGQSRNCVISREVYASLDRTGATDSFNINKLVTFAELLSSFVSGKSGNVPVQFFNSYSGTVKFHEKNKMEDSVVSINISSTAKKWETASMGQPSSNTCMFRFADTKLGSYLVGKTSPAFLYDGTEYCFRVDQSGAGYCSLTIPGSSSDENMGNLPLVAISESFRLSDFKSY